jgi:hypothetical protein
MAQLQTSEQELMAMLDQLHAFEDAGKICFSGS